MRYLTINEVEVSGHTPHLVYEGLVYAFEHAETGSIIRHDSLGYEAAVLMLDLERVETAPVRGRVI